MSKGWGRVCSVECLKGSDSMNSAKKPNIILITTDQQRFDTIAALGNESIITPHLDWMCDNGIVFTSAYSDAPVCIPARATIMTGRHGYHQDLCENTGRKMPRVLGEQLTIPKILGANGYQTKSIGKMHFHPSRACYGFDSMEISDNYYRKMGKQSERGVPSNHGLPQSSLTPVISTVDATNSITQWTMDQSVDFIETRDPTRPFFLWTSFSKPHPPLDPPREYWDLYNHIEIPDATTGDWSDNPDETPQSMMETTYLLTMAQRQNKMQIREAKRAYYACITQIDYTIGALIASLVDEGIRDNTWIVFTSDHGEMLGDHHMGGKEVFQEGSAHIPMFVVPPLNNDSMPYFGKVCDKTVCLADVLPTILDMADIEVPETVDGFSLMDQFNDKEGRDYLIGQCKNTYMVKTDEYKYIFYSEGGDDLLFDMKNDPSETVNLSKKAEFKKEVCELRKKLLTHFEKCVPELVENGEIKANPRSTKRPAYNGWPGFISPNNPRDLRH